MADQNQVQPSDFSFAQDSAPIIRSGDWDTKFDESIAKRAAKWLLTAGWILVSLVLGFIISTVWDLNGKIYEAVGRQESQSEIISTLRLEKFTLENQNKILKDSLLEFRLKNIESIVNKKGGKR